MQLIVFFNREQYYESLIYLFSNSVFKEVYNPTKIDPDGGKYHEWFNVNDSEDKGIINIIYIKDDGQPFSSNYNQSDAENAAILLFPDDSRLNYIPTQDYIILHHDKTGDTLKNLLNTDSKARCLNVIHQNEKEKHGGQNSLYRELLTFIGNSEKMTFQDFVKNHIKWIDPRIIAVDEFLKECFESNAINGNLDEMKKRNMELSFLEGKEFKDFASIRDYLFSQCNFESTNS